jgi:hypothetical protein
VYILNEDVVEVVKIVSGISVNGRCVLVDVENNLLKTCKCSSIYIPIFVRSADVYFGLSHNRIHVWINVVYRAECKCPSSRQDTKFV